MTNYTLKKILLSTHIICGIILLINLLSSYFGQLTIYFAFLQIIKYCFLISGVILFFFIKKLRAYFSIYIFSPIVAIVSLFCGLAGLVFVFMMVSVIWPKQMIANSNNYILYAKFGGPMKIPDAFELTQNKYFFFEKKIVEFINRENNENLKNCDLSVVNNTVEIKFTKEDINYETDKTTKTDTIIKIPIK